MDTRDLLTYLRVQKHVLILTGDIDSSKYEMVANSICELQQAGDTEDLLVILNSDGGSVAHALAMIEMFKYHPGNIIVWGVGSILSAGTLLLMAADIRILSHSTEVMVHQFLGGYGEALCYDELKNTKEWDETYQRMLELYERGTTLTKRQIKKKILTPHPTFYTAKEAQMLGMCEHVLGDLDE